MKDSERRQVVRIRRSLHELAARLETLELQSQLCGIPWENEHYDWGSMVRALSGLYEMLGIARDLTINAVREYGEPGFILPRSWVKRWEGAENAPSDHSATSE